MDIESPYWETWEAEFIALAEEAEPVPVVRRDSIKGARHYLCLYGDNGLSAEEELEELAIMRREKDHLKKVEVETSYWQDVVLFIP